MNRLGPVRQGDAAAWVVTLRDAVGDALTSVYDGAETLAARVWPGDDRPVSFNPTVAWKVAASGTIDLSVTGAQTAGVDPGDYLLQIRLTDGGSTYSAFESWLAIETAPGTGTTPTVYITRDDLLRYGRHVLSEIPDEYDQAGWIEQRARARSWFEQVLHAHDRGTIETGLGWGVRSRVVNRDRGKNTWLVDALADNELLVTDEIKEVNACYAWSLILAGRPEEAARFRAMANELCKTIVAELDTDADGDGDYVIDLTTTGI